MKRLAAALLLMTTAAAHAQLTAPRGAPPAPDKPATDKPGPDKPTPDRPAMTPTREVSVLYRVTSSGNPPAEVRITTLPNGAAMRIDMPDRTYMLVNQIDRRMAMVVPDEQTVLDLPWSGGGPQDQFTLNARMKFTRRGADTVAANRCTVWEVAFDLSRGIMCITDDGVLLRSLSQDDSGRRSQIDALSVSYTPAPPKEFVPPPDFEHLVQTPNGPGPAQ